MKEKELKENDRLSDVQENTNIRLMKMMVMIQDLRMESNQERKTWTRTQDERDSKKPQRKASQVEWDHAEDDYQVSKIK